MIWGFFGTFDFFSFWGFDNKETIGLVENRLHPTFPQVGETFHVLNPSGSQISHRSPESFWIIAAGSSRLVPKMSSRCWQSSIRSLANRKLARPFSTLQTPKLSQLLPVDQKKLPVDDFKNSAIDEGSTQFINESLSISNMKDEKTKNIVDKMVGLKADVSAAGRSMDATKSAQMATREAGYAKTPGSNAGDRSICREDDLTLIFRSVGL